MFHEQTVLSLGVDFVDTVLNCNRDVKSKEKFLDGKNTGHFSRPILTQGKVKQGNSSILTTSE